MLCGLTTLFFASHNMVNTIMARFLLVSLPPHSQSLGLLMAAFMVASLLSRPLLGKIADEGSKKTLMLLGIAVFVVVPILYLWCHTTWLFLPVRVFHGIGFALFATASASYLISVLPDKHRGEGISFHSNATKLALAFSPMLGLHLSKNNDFLWVFIISAAMALITLIVAFALPNPKADEVLATEPAQQSGQWINRKAVFPGLMIGANSALFGALIPFAPLMALEKHFGTIGLFYTIYVGALIASRGLTGPLSDRYGRVAIVLPGMAVVILSIYAVAMAPTKAWFMASAAFYGIASGTVQPSLIAMVADRAQHHERGSAMATFTMLSDLGQAVGYQMMGTLGVLIGFSQALPYVTIITIVGWLALLVYQKRYNHHAQVYC